MELPDDVLMIIKEYAQPMTRPDWRKGCYYNRERYECYGVKYPFRYLVLLIYRMYKYKITNLYDNMLYTELIQNTIRVY
jgi:hypothetical protein